MRTGLLAVLLLLSAAHVTQVSASPGKESSQCSALVDADFPEFGTLQHISWKPRRWRPVKATARIAWSPVMSLRKLGSN